MDINTTSVDFQKLSSDSLRNVNTNNMEDGKLRKVANDFEAYFMQQILDTSLKTSKIAGEGSGSNIIKGMYTQTMSRETAGSLGISDMLYKFLSENNRK